MSATAAGGTPWPLAWWRASTACVRPSTVASTSATLRPATIWRRCARRWSAAYLRGSRARAGSLPDLLLVDGGAAQLRQALAVLSHMDADSRIVAVGLSKGASRRPGWEQLHRADGDSLALPPDSDALHLLQRLRDEAHRFAISGQRRRQRRAAASGLEGITGIGPARRRALLRHFGGLRELRRASQTEIARAPGLGDKLAAAVRETLASQTRAADSG